MTTDQSVEVDSGSDVRVPIAVGARHGWPMPAKRLLDVVGAVGLLVVAAPVLAATAIAIRCTSRGPVLFRQERVGLAGCRFELLKFRSMYHGVSDAAHRAQNLAELAGDGRLDGEVAYKDAADSRITPVGRFIRRFSIDELPQLVNVVRGDMSLVGPRPSLTWEVEEFPPEIDRRFAVRPGITGVWQVGGRNQWSMLEMLEMDCRYVDELTLIGDVSILVRTVPAAIRGDGAA